MATKDDVKQALPAETVEFMKQMKALFVDEAEEERKRDERDLRAKERAQKAAQQAINAKQEQDRLAGMAAM